MSLRHAVLARLRVELTAPDARFVLAMSMLIALSEVLGGLSDDVSAGYAVTNAATLLRETGFVGLAALAVLMAGRDGELEVPGMLFTAGVPRVDTVAVRYMAALTLAWTLAVACLAAAWAMGLMAGGGDTELRGDYLWTALLIVPMWVALGTAVGATTRSRAKGLAVMALVCIVVLLIGRLAKTIPIFQWVNLASPAGIGEVLADGYTTDVVPRHAPGLAVMLFACLNVALPLAFVVRRERGAAAPRPPAAPASRRRLVAALAMAPVFGWAAPSAFASVIPWHVSPTWVFDQAHRNTPDRTVRRFVDALARGDTSAAARETATGDVGKTLGLLANEWNPAPADATVTLERRAEVAGTVLVEWHAGDERFDVRACAARFPDGWRIARFTSQMSCKEGA